METHWNKELNKRTEVHKRLCGTAGPFRGKKRSLFEGGVRVPALLEWPVRIKKPRVVKMACCTSDYFPTVMDILGLKKRGQLESLDGVSLLPMIEGKMTERPKPLAFESRDSMSLTDNRYKIIKPGAFDIRDGWADPNDDKKYMLFDLIEDPSEKKDLASMKPEIVKRMKLILEKWRESCKKSYEGKDYKEGP
jgi:arylsulfatase A-like enzyme